MNTRDDRDVDGILDALGLRPRHGSGSRDWVANWMEHLPFPRSGEGGYPAPGDIGRLVDIAIEESENPHPIRLGRAVGGVAHIITGVPWDHPDWCPDEWAQVKRLSTTSDRLGDLLGAAIELRQHPEEMRLPLAEQGIEGL